METFAPNQLNNFEQDKDLTWANRLFLTIGLSIGMVFCAFLLIVTISVCVRRARRNSYDRIEFLSMKSYQE